MKVPFSVKVRALSVLVLLAAATALSGCASNAPQLTATVFEQARVEMESLRSTATVVRARMKTTLEYAAARVAQAEDAGEFLQFSLISLGTEPGFITTQVSQIDSRSTPTAPASSPASTTEPRQAEIGGVTPIALSRAAGTANRTRPAVTSPPQARAAGPRLENIVMASGVNQYDCAIDVNPVFTPASTEIYVVAEARNIPAGAKISSRWHRQGIEVAYFSFDVENQIDGNCIWFFIDQTDTAFFAGAWSVELRVDDVPLGSPVAFQVRAN